MIPNIFTHIKDLLTPTFATVLFLIGGLLCAFFGYKLVRLFITVSGFCLGLGAALTVCEYAGIGTPVNYILALIIGGVLAWLCFRIIRIGTFVMSAVLAYIVLTGFFPGTYIPLIGALIAGCLGVTVLKAVVIILTAVGGSYIAANSVQTLFVFPLYLTLIIWVIFAVGGMVYQFMTKERKN